MESLGGEGVQNFWLEWGDKPEKGGGVDVEMGGVATFFITLQFNHITVYVWEGGVRSPLLLFGFQSFELARQDSHRSLYRTKTWYHLYISDLFW